MKVENVKKTEAVVQLEFTVKMTKKELEDLVEVLGCTSVSGL